jgi:threonine aldolase
VASLIDLRSDTLTKPTAEMRRAMAAAEVGDDYYREDPSVLKLEALAARMLGREAGLLVLSGTMGNLVSVLSWADRGSSVLAEERAHIFYNENGSLAGVGGITTKTFRGARGFPTPDEVSSAVFPAGLLHPPTRVLCIENTHNAAGGTCLDVASLNALCATARAAGLKVHVDGARLFNAAIALGVPAAALAEKVDSVTFCLTKGLGCPVGSLVVGERDFIERARRWRQHVGGNMRQAGVFAAAGIVGLSTMVDRLAEDHANAKLLANALADLGWDVNPAAVETNMVFAGFEDPEFDVAGFVDALAAAGVRVNPPRARRIRFVTHADVSTKNVRDAAEIVARVYREATLSRKPASKSRRVRLSDV